ncbi:MAG: hypothetical protein KJZ54_13180 [Phycisphaerales bacterium]|nr:hypothetical protein [Phycisphaerales bacterium]
MEQIKRMKGRGAALAVVAGILAAGGLGGCSNAGEGAASGAALGALAGMGLGSLTGDMGKGAAAGAIIGGVGGAIIGDQNNRNDNRGRSRSDW